MKAFASALALMILSAAAGAEPVKHQVTGLFAADREADLREAVAKIEGVTLVSVDFETAEATFDYDPKKKFPGANPDQVVQRLDDLVRGASYSTFGVKPLRTTPREKLTLVVIPVAGLDCKACSLAAYEAVYRLDGVERATASFRDGRVTALIDPQKIDRARIEEALKKRGVDLKAR